jgi:hypothetical protein
MAPTWKLDAEGRRVVEPKDKIKERLGRSPDGLDALNLAYYTAGDAGPGFTPIAERNNPAGGWTQWGGR